MLRRALPILVVSLAFVSAACGADRDVGDTPNLGDTGDDATAESGTDATTEETAVEDTGSSSFDIGSADTSAPDAPMFADTTVTKPDVGGGEVCLEGGAPAGAGPLPRVCAPLTANECAGGSDVNGALPNGTFGNGFDDDCDGIVDEGCACDPGHPAGTTKDCFLVPSSQAAAGTNTPVGWCASNSKGTMACITVGTGEFKQERWDGNCVGAQPPYTDDVCVTGDFDCDGKDSNSKTEDCSCNPPPEVTCPTDAIVHSPYPDPADLEKKKNNPLDPKLAEPFIIDGWRWIGGGDAALSTNWVWTITGGDCDTILPHPTFAIYNGKNSTTATRIGVEIPTLGSSGKQKGLLTLSSPTQHQIWPAFSLSGDYLVQGSFTLRGKNYSCTQRVRVRWPGVRAELCWDTKGGAENVASDIDLHLARLQGTSCANKHGWFDACGKAPSMDDCYYMCDSGCRTGNNAFCRANLNPANAPAPGWGYTASGAEACHGWGSLREVQQTCDNPRLDRDNYGCDAAKTDIQDPKYCGPENINIDNPKADEQFAVGAHYYRSGNTSTGTTAHPHVNVYCNGERKLSLGYDPTTTPATDYPRLSTGANPTILDSKMDGDFWNVARVKWNGTAADPCLVEPITSTVAKATKDGSTNSCVETNPQNVTSPNNSTLWLFTQGGVYPVGPAATPDALCWH